MAVSTTEQSLEYLEARFLNDALVPPPTDQMKIQTRKENDHAHGMLAARDRFTLMAKTSIITTTSNTDFNAL